MAPRGKASAFGAVNFARGGQICRCVPPPKKAVLSWLCAAPNVEGGRLKWGFSWVFNQLNEYKQNHMKGRQRGRNGGGGGGGKPRPPGRNPNFDGGGNNRPRGNAQQLMEKYLALARDATSAGDRVLAENYFQHADHYYRVLNARFEQQNNGQRRFEGQGGQHQNYDNRQGGYGPYDDQQPQHGPGGGYPQYQQPQQQPQQQPPQQHHTPAPEPEPQPQPQQAHDAEIALPPGILGDAPLEGGAEPQEAEAQQEGGDQPRERGSRDRGRRRRGRGERAFAGAANE